MNAESAPPDYLLRALPRAHRLAWYRPGQTVHAADRMQNYSYTLTARAGRDFAADFAPDLTPAQMLRAGIFEGRYLNDCAGELPHEWFAAALQRGRLRAAADVAANEFGVKSRLSLGEWRRRGWLPQHELDRDVRGWFQWYCRYWLGRRIPAVDALQIARWRSFARHRGQILASYRRLGQARPQSRAEKRAHRARQRQALLQWAYDPYV